MTALDFDSIAARAVAAGRGNVRGTPDDVICDELARAGVTGGMADREYRRAYIAAEAHWYEAGGVEAVFEANLDRVRARDGITREALWEDYGRGYTQRQIARALDVPQSTLSQRSLDLGFSLRNGKNASARLGRVDLGPCVECGRPHPPCELTEGHRCAGCADEQREAA